MLRIIIFIVSTFILLEQSAQGLPSPLTGKNVTAANLQTKNKTISQMVKEQTDAIKKIVASQKPLVPSRKDQNDKKENDEKDDLRLRCHHFFKFSGGDFPIGKTADENIDVTAPPTVPTAQPQISPEKQTSTTTPKITTTTRQIEQTTVHPQTKGYYIFPDTIQNAYYETSSGKNNRIDSAANLKNEPIKSTMLPNVYHNIEEITEAPKPINKYEPVVYRKTLLSNGQNYYYWYHAIPHYSQENEQDNLETSASEIVYAKPVVYNANDAFINYNQYTTTTIKAPTSTTRPTTTTPKPTTTTTPVMPTYEVIYKLPDNGKPDENKPKIYKSELRFVLPMALPGYPNVLPSYPYEVDPYAYYPKNIQPNLMNIQVPYVPTFHMIRTLAVPDDEIEPDSTIPK